MAKIVVTGKIPHEGIDLLTAEHEVDAWDSLDQMPRDEMLRRIKGADAVLTLLTEKVDDEFLDAAGEQLKVVANVAVGYNNIDVPALEKRGVVGSNTPKVLTETTADTAFALMMMVTRRFGEAERVIRSKTPWQWGMFYMLGMGLQGKTLGVVGLGQIGAALGRRAKAFGMDVVYSDRSEAPADVVAELGAKRMDMDEMLRTVDVISLHCPYLDSTHHLMSTEQFKLMKPTAYLVNTARGPIVDEQALVDALKAGELAGAGLDVFEKEPEVHEALLTMDNVVLLPHLGSATIETRTAMATLAARNALNVLAGKAPETPITK
ncbi:nicotinate-nucleotide pyrophosphorylase [Platysternon megacephalum]|uniref:Nicotinate-nucleotide pyrophosphorylase n=1 Tax=Platysternon megacephalum TaxID=55544 RepID=A0A4D9DCA2_9SAUR|nr:nicotinate-nucleotide pyrophosphorylase [Platysternon megacephalum]